MKSEDTVAAPHDPSFQWYLTIDRVGVKSKPSLAKSIPSADELIHRRKREAGRRESDLMLSELVLLNS